MASEIPSPPSRLLDDVRHILRQARHQVYAAANAAMVDAYWQIGRRIVEEEQGGSARAEYGTQLIRNLARDLSDEFGKGLSVANLKNFRQFYLTFSDAGKSYALRSQLSWTHWRLVMRVENPQARDYYIEETARQQWSSRTLERAIETHTFKRLLKAPEPTVSAAPAAHPLHLLKDPYILEFLDLPDHPEPGERQLEDALVTRLRDFLMELGKGFSFVGRQFRVSTETSHFYVDLVFYNYLLKCFVLIDLKTKKLTHENIGQMDMYVRMFDDLKRGVDDNPTLGIILCADKDETLVRYSVLSESQQLFASKYRLILPSEEELAAELERRHILDWPVKGGADE
jgi:predicted nuclease of restriction endonuclease-like (RecB) superfamily